MMSVVCGVERVLRALVLLPIVVWQRFISPGIPRRCRYEPTCSAYAYQAIRRYGIARGLVLGTWRLLRCNPFTPGGFDPVEEQGVFPLSRHLPGHRHAAEGA